MDAEIDGAAEIATPWRPAVLDRVRCEDTGEGRQVVEKEIGPVNALVRILKPVTKRKRKVT